MHSSNMPGFDAAMKLRDRIVDDLENMSYEQLLELSASLETDVDGWTTLRREEFPGGALAVHALISQWGLMRRRISVEVAISSDDRSIQPGVIPCIYFERFASGHFFRPSARGTIVIVGLGLALVGVALIWLLCVNGGK